MSDQPEVAEAIKQETPAADAAVTVPSTPVKMLMEEQTSSASKGTDTEQPPESTEQNYPTFNEEPQLADGEEIDASEDAKLAEQTSSRLSLADDAGPMSSSRKQETTTKLAAPGDEEQQTAERPDISQAGAELRAPASSNTESGHEKAEEQPSEPKPEGEGDAIVKPSSPAPPAPLPKSPVVPAPQVPSKDADHEAGFSSALATGSSMEAQGSSSGKSNAVSSYDVVAHAFGKRVGTSSQSGSRSGSPAPRSASSLSQQKEGQTLEKPELRSQEVSQANERQPPKRKESIPTSQAAEEASFDFNRFLEQMKHRSAAPVGEYVRSFIRGFSRKPYRTSDQIKLINDFLDFISQQMAQTPPWSTVSEKEFENAKEAMEKLVMNRLYPFTFSPAVAKEGRWPVQNDDLERDSVLLQKMRLFEWVKEEHLDVPVGEHSKGFVEFGVTELLKINHYKAPRDKLICILNCSKVIFGLIRHLGGGEDADTFLPILIFIVLKARPENLISNVEYINRFRSPERLSSESGYYLSSLMGAITFIEQLDFSSLSNITQEEFEKNIETAAVKLAKESEESERRSRPSSEGHGESGEEEARSIGFAPVAAALADDTRVFLQRTGEAARLGVTKPIGAIGRFLSEATSEGSRTPMSGGSESGPESPERGQSPANLPPGTPRTRLFGLLGEGSQGPGTPSTAPRPSPGLNFASWGRSFRGASGEDPEGGVLQTPAHPPGQGPVTPAAPRPPRLAEHFQDPNRYPGEISIDGGEERGDPRSPSHQRGPTRRQAPPEESPSMHPNDVADMSAEVDRVHREKLEAAVETLKGIFPETEHDVCMMVLESCGGDVQAAIDKLLEMS